MRPAPWTRTSTSPSPGSGSGRSSTWSCRVGRDHEGLHAPTVLLVGGAWAGNYRALVPAPALAILDDDGEEVLLDAEEAANLFALTGDLDAATVSACPRCRSRILAVVALADLLDDAPLFTRAGELVLLADEAPTLHVYVRDLAARCAAPRDGATRGSRSGPT